MFRHIKVKNHKGISSINLDDLSHINIVFGKNNSGKTSILEAIAGENTVAVGKTLDDPTVLIEQFAIDAGKYFDPVARRATKSFSAFIDSLREKDPIWYWGEEQQIIDECSRALATSKDLKHLEKFYDMEKILEAWFADVAQSFRPIYVPPKRKLEVHTPINLLQNIENYGAGVSNYLFYLKNQQPSSVESELFELIAHAFTSMSDYEFDVVPDQKNMIRVVFRRLSEDVWISADDSGLGLADLLILATLALGTHHSLVCIEEPESHLHPEIQKRFLSFLTKINNKQFVLSTHSHVFLNPAMVDTIYYTRYRDNGIEVSNQTASAVTLYNLGYSISDHLTSDAIILVESASDEPVLEEVFRYLGLDARYCINYFPLSDEVKAYLDLSIFVGQENVFALTYSRHGKEVATDRFFNNCEQMGIRVRRMSKAAIENYFSIEALRVVFGDEIPDDIEQIKPDLIVDAQIGFSLAHKTVKTHNNRIVGAMDLREIDGSDLVGFCREVMSALAEQNPAKHTVHEAEPPNESNVIPIDRETLRKAASEG